MASMYRWKLNGLLSDVPREGVPPRVWPLVENTGGAIGPASLTAFSMAIVRPRVSAPLIVLIMLPFRKMRKVGMLCLCVSESFGDLEGYTYAVTPYFCAISCWLSTFTLVKVIRFGLEYLVERDSKVGEIALHGPHQSA